MNTVLFSWFTHACISVGWIIRACVSLPSVDKFNSVPSLLHYLSLQLIACESPSCQHSFLMVRSLLTRAQGVSYMLHFSDLSLLVLSYKTAQSSSWQYCFFQSRSLYQKSFTFKGKYSGNYKENCLQIWFRRPF